jgi:hypothetical protein
MSSFTIPETLTSGSHQQEEKDTHVFYVLMDNVCDSKRIYPRLEEPEFK